MQTFIITGKRKEQHYDDEVIKELKYRNGVLPLPPSKEEKDKLEELFYQASMFNDLGGK